MSSASVSLVFSSSLSLSSPDTLELLFWLLLLLNSENLVSFEFWLADESLGVGVGVGDESVRPLLLVLLEFELLAVDEDDVDGVDDDFTIFVSSSLFSPSFSCDDGRVG